MLLGRHGTGHAPLFLPHAVSSAMENKFCRRKLVVVNIAYIVALLLTAVQGHSEGKFKDNQS